MDLESEKAIWHLYEQAMEMSPSARRGFVTHQASHAPHLLEEVLKLIEAAENLDQKPDALENLYILGRKLRTQLEIEPEPDYSGQTFGHYQLQHQIGKGGMGVVYKAWDLQNQRVVALKVLPKLWADNPERRRRFQREARAIACLNHPHIVSLYAADQHEEIHFLAMEYIEGETLDACLEKGPLELKPFLQLMVPILQAIVAAHQNGVTHRDLKPSNIMIDREGQPRLLDFGLAKILPQELESVSQSESITTEGRVIGSIPYMAPEQLRGQPADARSDQFSLGIIMYELLTGRRPFQGQTASDLIGSILRDHPGPVTDGRASLPAELDQIINRCLQKEREGRYPSIEELLAELLGLSHISKAALLRGRLKAWFARRKTTRIALPLVGLLVLVTIVLLVNQPYIQSRRHYRQALKQHELAQFDPGLIFLKRALELDPDYAEAYMLLSKYQTAMGLRKEAFASAQKAFDLRESVSPRVRHNIAGRYYLNQLNYEKAKEEYKALTTLGEADDEAYMQLVHCYAALRQTDNEVSAAQVAVKKVDGVVEHGSLIIAYADNNQWDQALAQFEVANQRYPNHPYFYWGKGLAHLGKDEFEQAKEAFLKLSEGPDDAYHSMGQALYARALAAEALSLETIQHLEKGLERDLEVGQGDQAHERYLMLAWCSFWAGQPDKVKFYLDEIPRTELPSRLKLYREACLLYQLVGAEQEAGPLLRLIDELAQAYPSNLAQGFYAQLVGNASSGDRAAASRYFTKAKEYWRDPLTIWTEARFLEKDSPAQAVALYREVVAAKGWVLRYHHPGYLRDSQRRIELLSVPNPAQESGN